MPSSVRERISAFYLRGKWHSLFFNGSKLSTNGYFLRKNLQKRQLQAGLTNFWVENQSYPHSGDSARVNDLTGNVEIQLIRS